jgi:hypothetical protein
MNTIHNLPNSNLTPSLAREFIMRKNAEIKKAYNNKHPQPYNASLGGRRSRRMTRRVKGRKTRSHKK